jgi:hypothetical protein
MPRLYGDRISDAESAELIAKLRARGTSEAIVAADTVGKGPRRDATVATSLQARDTILLELCDWDGLDEEAPRLAGLRDRLAAPQHGLRIL